MASRLIVEGARFLAGVTPRHVQAQAINGVLSCVSLRVKIGIGSPHILTLNCVLLLLLLVL